MPQWLRTASEKASGETGREEIVTPLEADLFFLLNLGLDHADYGQPGEAFGARQGRSEPTQPTYRETLWCNLQPAMGFVEALGDVELCLGALAQ